MDSASFKTLIEKLRYKLNVSGGVGEPKALMVPFNDVEDGKLDCPWLEWATKDWGDSITPRGILMMQDWGLQGESLSKAVSIIEAYSRNSPSGDRTLSSLFAVEAWKTAILNRSILVTNAAWGLRPSTEDAPNKMCGYLGAVIHKGAFLRWGQLVAQLSTETQNGNDFRLFVAGGWGRFDGEENRSATPIKDYLGCWKSWASKSLGAVTEFPEGLSDTAIKECHGHVVFLSHPCTWNRRFEADPFAALDLSPAREPV